MLEDSSGLDVGPVDWVCEVCGFCCCEPVPAPLRSSTAAPSCSLVGVLLQAASIADAASAKIKRFMFVLLVD
jgi:hypothetical protein